MFAADFNGYLGIIYVFYGGECRVSTRPYPTYPVQPSPHAKSKLGRYNHKRGVNSQSGLLGQAQPWWLTLDLSEETC